MNERERECQRVRASGRERARVCVREKDLLLEYIMVILEVVGIKPFPQRLLNPPSPPFQRPKRAEEGTSRAQLVWEQARRIPAKIFREVNVDLQNVSVARSSHTYASYQNAGSGRVGMECHLTLIAQTSAMLRM